MITEDTYTAQEAGESAKYLLAWVACSFYWVWEVVTPADADGRWHIYDERYPPGGTESAMRECVCCQRITPPNGINGRCCDCQVEHQEDLLDIAEEESGLRLRPLSWSQLPPYFELVEETTTSWQSSDKEACDEGPNDDEDDVSVSESIAGGTTKVVIDIETHMRKAGFDYGAHERLRLRNGIGPARDSYLQVEQALYQAKSEPGVRARGCAHILLPETDRALSREMCYFSEHGEVIHSADWNPNPNPYRKR